LFEKQIGLNTKKGIERGVAVAILASGLSTLQFGQMCLAGKKVVGQDIGT